MDELDNIEWLARAIHTYRWTLNYNVIAVDITKDFNSKYRLSAYTFLTDEMEEDIREQIKNGKFSVNSNINRNSATTPRRILYGDDDDVPLLFGFPNLWTTTNCTRSSINDTGTSNRVRNVPVLMFPPETIAHDGFQVEFTSVPYPILKRYWNRPVRLKSRWHTTNRKYTRTSVKPCGDVLSFNKASIQRKTIQANFEHGSYGGNTGRYDPMWNIQTKAWVKTYIPTMRILTDESPFVKDEHEFLFITEFL